jgi:transcriptional regulator
MTEARLPLSGPEESTLHTSDAFRVLDVSRMTAWLAAYPLVSLVSADDGRHARSSVAPLILRTEANQLRLFSHLDRRNPQAAHATAGRPFLVIAQGPRSYVSPAWFPRRPAAPTYLHITVHVQCVPEVIAAQDAEGVLLDTVAAFEKERDGWEFDGGERYLSGMSKGITAFELHVRGIEAACKLSQNRDAEEQAAIAARLEQSDMSDDKAIAALIRRSLSTDVPAGGGN